MRKLLLIPSLLLLCSVWALGQSSMQGSSSSDSQKTIEGCLSGSDGNFTLTDSSGKTYALQGESSKLSEHVGHQVRVKGSEAGASASATTPSGETASATAGKSGGTPPSGAATKPPSSAGGTASAAIQFKVSSVEKVSDTCSK